MPEIVYGTYTCVNCGREGTLWGVEVVKDEFLCELCIRIIVDKIADKKREEESTSIHQAKPHP